MPVRIDRHLAFALACLAPCAAVAQAPQVSTPSPMTWPNAQDMDRALKAHPLPDANRLGSQPVPQPPRVNPRTDAIDIEAIARSNLRLQGSSVATESPATPLRIFITLEMPRTSLRLLTDQAARSGAVLVLRGLKSQSMRQTIAVVGELIGDRKVAWVIDPEAFTRFGVRQAPTFVLALNDATGADAQGNCSSGCATPAGFVSVSGDVSLDYALEAILRRRPEAALLAEPILKRMRGSP